MKKIITAALACAMIVSSLCACAQQTVESSGFPEPLPERYVLSELGLVTESKSQASTGLCAAYAIINACESNLLLKGYESADDLDLSEAHLYYYQYAYEEDRGCGEDGNYFYKNRDEATEILLWEGSVPPTLINMLANGVGPVREDVVEFDPKDRAGSVENLNIAHKNGDIEKYMGDYLLTEANFLTNFRQYGDIFVYQDSMITDLQRSIYENGAASAGVTTSKVHFNESDAGIAYYQGFFDDEEVYQYVQHAVSVVGWDNNFSRENFGRTKPDYDGAWLIKDSTGGVFGEHYYWVSYEEKLAEFTTVELVPRDEYGDILFHDSLNMTGNIRAPGSETVAANVFTVDKDCKLKAVGIPTSAHKQPVTVEIYRNPEGNDPGSGKRAAELQTVIDMPGYHVVDLNKAVKLRAGDRFSIVVRYKNDITGSDYWRGRVPVEGAVSEEEKAAFVAAGAPYETVLTSEPGQSYAMYDGLWYDTSDPATAGLFGLDVPINNFGIKALMENEQ